MDSTAGRVILVVDDVSVDRKLAARCLEREGHKYCLAYDGMQALQMLRSQAIDLVSPHGGRGKPVPHIFFSTSAPRLRSAWCLL
jgi:hypothetical protein